MAEVLSGDVCKKIYVLCVQSNKYLLLPAANLYDMMQKPSYLGFCNLAQKRDVLVVDLASPQNSAYIRVMSTVSFSKVENEKSSGFLSQG